MCVQINYEYDSQMMTDPTSRMLQVKHPANKSNGAAKAHAWPVVI
jgi:hypothetical protein